jgi:polyhydroxyalkanoate synthesis repressor PhaR
MSHAQPRLIKRYANRKLYDTQRSAYVTLDEIAELVKAGEDIQIVDNRSGEDMTGVTLTQIIYEDQKNTDEEKGLPLAALRSIIQQGGGLFAKLKVARDKIEDQSHAAVRDLVEGTREVIEDRQKRIDNAVKDTFTQMTHYAEIQQQLQTIDRRLDGLEALLTDVVVLLETRTDAGEEPD